MKVRAWRACALIASITVVVLLATQKAAGQPSAEAATYAQPVVQSVQAGVIPSNLPAIPESGSLLVLGSAFVVVAQQLRRMV